MVTKEIYLGKKVPSGLEKMKGQLFKEGKKELYSKLEKIKAHFQREWERLPESAKQREKEEIAIAFTYNTNAIEGSTITLEETREILVDKTAPNKSLRDIKETEAHAKVFLKMLDSKEQLSRTLLLRWHQEIFGETKGDIAGRYRNFLVRVGPYVAPDWQEVKGLMRELISWAARSKENPVELAALAHYRFERIHPFGDGNGRIGRLISNMILWQAGYPMLIIEYKRRSSYYRALQSGEERFRSYFLQRYLAVHRKRYL